MAFQVHRGTNISHWLSQSKRRGQARVTWFTEDDIQYIAGLGFDHVRLPIDEVQMWDAEGKAEVEAFDLLQSAIGWSKAAGLRVIVDLHILRSHYLNDKTGEPALFSDPVELARFVDLWRDLSAQLGGWSNDLVAYELLNEAVARDPEDWNRVSRAAFDAVRDLESERTIVLGSNWFCQHHTFEALAVPDDEHCILTYHYYYPMLVTHHQAKWCDGGEYAGPIQYPGTPIAAKDLAGLDESLLSHMDEWNVPFERSNMVADLAQPLAVRERTGLPLYCGEFGCYERTPQALRLAWYRDMMQTLNEHDIAWANWDYKGLFGIVDAGGRDTGIASVLLE